MSTTIYTRNEIAERGQERYEQEIRRHVEAVHYGKMLALDVESGEYAVADDSLSALDAIKVRYPDALVHIVRIGFPTAVKIGVGREVMRKP